MRPTQGALPLRGSINVTKKSGRPDGGIDILWLDRWFSYITGARYAENCWAYALAVLGFRVHIAASEPHIYADHLPPHRKLSFGSANDLPVAKYVAASPHCWQEARTFARRRGVPLIALVQDYREPEWIKADPFDPDYVITSNTWQKQKLAELYPRVPVHVVPIPMDMQPCPARRRTDDIVVLGRLHETKHCDLACEVARALRSNYSWQGRMLFVGPDEQNLVPNLLSRYPETEYLGLLSASEKWDRLARARLVLHPSNVEGFSITIGEALRAGTPVVARDLELYRAIWREGVTLATGVDAMAQACWHLMQDTSAWQTQSRRGRRFTKQNYSRSAMLRAMHDFACRLTNRPKVSVVVYTYNHLTSTQKTVAAVFDHTPPPYEFIISDDGSTDGTQHWAQTSVQPAQLLVNTKSTHGIAENRNRAIKAANSEIVVQLDNDNLVTPGWLDAYNRVFQSHPHAALVGPLKCYLDGTPYVTCVGFDENGDPTWCFQPYVPPNGEQVFRCNSMQGLGTAVRKSVWRAVGGYTSLAQFWYEDTDFCMKLYKGGHAMYITTQARLLHEVGTTASEFWDIYEDVKNKFVKKWKKYLPLPVEWQRTER